ncbi:CYTH and CHAD domain-containing protein [Ferribacterium limneticum]|uniref:CYTH and CHAD domain-containing protein n=1 Tax=Ferribacterium limneticum TaxID=76259 RepID=UPI001CFB14D9|nr:CYTH and CHAD domain-containing protein [Ferribacterium limneticum]UCV29296.1 CYTH and CHAD domain-containing protein [Ferribacterium limneticum]UCV33215.1 CYTH and CHAD domain-containing protein [Ferribacterium limneticum]
MSTEIELKLQLSPKAARKLASHPLLEGIPTQRQHLLNTYYDTPKLELHARRIAVRFRKKGWQWLCTVKSAEPASGGLAMRSEWETPATPGIFDFSHVDAADFRKFLEQRSDQFEAIFTTDFHRQIWHVPFGDSQIELAIDRGHIESQGRSTPICEIELELLSGKVDDIFGLTRELQTDLDLHPAIASKAERGYNLFLDTPLRPFKARPTPINEAQTPVEAFRSIALCCLEHFQRNEKGLQAGSDAEFIHQARVALRRLRSAIKLFAPALPPEFVTAYGQTWQTLAGALGDTRNWDVFLEETLPPIAAAFPEHKDIKRLRKAAQLRASSARKSVIGLLAVSEYPRLLLEFTAAVYTLSDTLDTPLKDFARQQIASRARKARKLATRHADLSPAERHKMRIAFKKLRYTLEFFAPLLPQRRLKLYLSVLSQLQEELGLVNDYVTAETLVAEELAGHPTGPIHGWVKGRHQLLLTNLPDNLEIWLAQQTPW